MSKKKRDTDRIGKWSHDHRHDKAYRSAQAEGSRRYQEQLYRDAAFGRIARTLLSQFGELFKELAEKEEEVYGITGATPVGDVEINLWNVAGRDNKRTTTRR